MILLLRNGNYIEPDSYGFSTWRSTSTISVVKRHNKWWYKLSDLVDAKKNIWNDYYIKMLVKKELKKLPEGAELLNDVDYKAFLEAK